MGVSVSETKAETMMAIASVMANSRSSRPTTSRMNKSGINTASSDTVNEMMVKAICFEPLIAASKGLLAVFDTPCDVFDHHNGVVHHESGGNGERHR